MNRRLLRANKSVDKKEVVTHAQLNTILDRVDTNFASIRDRVQKDFEQMAGDINGTFSAIQEFVRRTKQEIEFLREMLASHGRGLAIAQFLALNKDAFLHRCSTHGISQAEALRRLNVEALAFFRLADINALLLDMFIYRRGQGGEVPNMPAHVDHLVFAPHLCEMDTLPLFEHNKTTDEDKSQEVQPVPDVNAYIELALYDKEQEPQARLHPHLPYVCIGYLAVDSEMGVSFTQDRPKDSKPVCVWYMEKQYWASNLGNKEAMDYAWILGSAWVTFPALDESSSPLNEKSHYDFMVQVFHRTLDRIDTMQARHVMYAKEEAHQRMLNDAVAQMLKNAQEKKALDVPEEQAEPLAEATPPQQQEQQQEQQQQENSEDAHQDEAQEEEKARSVIQYAPIHHPSGVRIFGGQN